jgi:hypothetical protein
MKQWENAQKSRKMSICIFLPKFGAAFLRFALHFFMFTFCTTNAFYTLFEDV